MLQPVPWKMRLEMVIGMQNQILIGIKNLPFYVSFQIFKWNETSKNSFMIPIRIWFCISMTISSLIFHGSGCTHTHATQSHSWDTITQSRHAFYTLNTCTHRTKHTQNHTMKTLNRTAETWITQSRHAFYTLNLLILELFYEKLRITYSYPTRSKTNSREGQIELQFVFLAFECRYRAHSHVHRDNVYRTYTETMCISHVHRDNVYVARTQRQCVSHVHRDNVYP